MRLRIGSVEKQPGFLHQNVQHDILIQRSNYYCGPLIVRRDTRLLANHAHIEVKHSLLVFWFEIRENPREISGNLQGSLKISLGSIWHLLRAEPEGNSPPHPKPKKSLEKNCAISDGSIFCNKFSIKNKNKNKSIFHWNFNQTFSENFSLYIKLCFASKSSKR